VTKKSYLWEKLHSASVTHGDELAPPLQETLCDQKCAESEQTRLATCGGDHALTHTQHLFPRKEKHLGHRKETLLYTFGSPARLSMSRFLLHPCRPAGAVAIRQESTPCYLALRALQPQRPLSSRSQVWILHTPFEGDCDVRIAVSRKIVRVQLVCGFLCGPSVRPHWSAKGPLLRWNEVNRRGWQPLRNIAGQQGRYPLHLSEGRWNKSCRQLRLCM